MKILFICITFSCSIHDAHGFGRRSKEFARKLPGAPMAPGHLIFSSCRGPQRASWARRACWPGRCRGMWPHAPQRAWLFWASCHWTWVLLGRPTEMAGPGLRYSMGPKEEMQELFVLRQPNRGSWAPSRGPRAHSENWP